MAKKKLPILGDFIKKQLYIMGKTQTWLAEQCGCNKGFISQIVMGKSKPGFEISEKIAKALGVTSEEIRKMAIGYAA